MAAIGGPRNGGVRVLEDGPLTLAICRHGPNQMAGDPGRATVALSGRAWHVPEGAGDAEPCEVLDEADAWLGAVAPDAARMRLTRSWGGFALALHDRASGAVVLAVDRFGQRSLYYAQTPYGIAFSTSLRALAALLPERTLDEQALVDVLCFRVMAGRRTLVRGVGQVEPGSMVVLARGRAPTMVRYWTIEFGERPRTQPLEQWQAQTIGALRDGVGRMCERARHVNVFLSGGVDSSIVAALAREVATDVTALTLEIEGFHNAELARAKEVAATLGIRHEVIQVRTSDIAANFRWLSHVFEQPPRQVNNLALVELYRRAAELGGPVLSGVAADTLFGAAEPFLVRAFRARARARTMLGPSIAGALGRLIGTHARGARAARIAEALCLDIEDRCLRVERLEYGRASAALVDRMTGGSLASEDLLANVWRGPDNLTSKVRRLHLHMSSRAEMTRNAAMGGALGVETYYPFLWHRVVELALTMPDELHRQNGLSKPVLRRICAGLVSQRVAYWSKMGFPTPNAVWMRDALGSVVERLAHAHPLLDRIVPAQARAALDPVADFELLWGLMTLGGIADDFGGLRFGGCGAPST